MKPLPTGSNSTISQRLQLIEQTLPESVRLVAVSKTHPTEVIVEAYEAGQRIFAESRVQELVAKHDELSSVYLDLQWHFIGPLQTNKVKYLAPLVAMIESVDSIRLIDEINKQALKYQRSIPILLEIHIAQEESKSGFAPEELMEVIEHLHRYQAQYTGIKLCGLMAIATYTDDQKVISEEFALMKSLWRQVKGSGLLSAPECFTELSMGMSSDYETAIAYGATMVRIGSAIFGER